MRPVVATDVIVEYTQGDKDGIVLIQRKNPPYGLAIPGGMYELGLTLEQNAMKEIMEECGLEVLINEPDRPFCVMSDPRRDPRGHIMSVVYVGRGKGNLRAGDDAAEARLYTLEEVRGLISGGSLAFDHSDILKMYLEYRGGTR